MSPERWLQIYRVFESAVRRPAAEREAHLDRACAGDPPLRAEVAALLAHHGQTGGAALPPLSEGDTGPEASGGSEESAAPVESTVRYRPLRFHAAGGLGEVHLARDEYLQREVALKRIKPDRADEPEYRRRFLREAAITGQLAHPGVVPVFGLGQGFTSSTGYFSGEYLEKPGISNPKNL